MKRYLIATALALLAGLATGGARADPILAEVRTFAFTSCPNGWAPLNGQLLPISQNQPLFSLLGTRYGGNGQTTFALPTARPVYSPSGALLLQCIALEGLFPALN